MRKTTIGLVGSGSIGSMMARLAVAAGHDVVLSNSGGPQTLRVGTCRDPRGGGRGRGGW